MSEKVKASELSSERLSTGKLSETALQLHLNHNIYMFINYGSYNSDFGNSFGHLVKEKQYKDNIFMLDLINLIIFVKIFLFWDFESQRDRSSSKLNWRLRSILQNFCLFADDSILFLLTLFAVSKFF